MGLSWGMWGYVGLNRGMWVNVDICMGIWEYVGSVGVCVVM